ncbi:putative serine protease F56F10.1 [Ooceraea biroi]|uniref:Putative serine protease F56F10.1 n=1 Tax=Ooceraea biroi TaxID=2015173 RepID=A0A026WIN4_OOCBI|nr:putative serine protease F56F10.1 [Ooceraea biroi]XP_011336786.1 putative serine protease F56F10.1 [Ooceraea biroi]XP_011336787.1 putative serine protease F56F10.1 [Ooceraea biroi]XP_019887101.1 putative serine protease F56F10.1 [Ooceraea biroi]EZA55516.1 Putative serine protease F56F10.1 [Ooceraea biroi]
MRFLLLLSALLGIISVSTGWRTFMRGRSRYDNLKELSSDDELPKEQWFTQEFDHFSPFNNRVWKQRYFVNSDYYKPNGPIFLMIGAEGFIDPKWMVEGQWIEYAKEFGAMCFYLEHRYYGKSHPTPDLSVKNLGLLSSELALADVANFIEQINVGYKFPKGTKWIAFGGSYGGSLAAWMRVKYAHLVHGAVSSSGPLLLEIDFQEYYVVVENALKEYSQQCVDAVQEGNRQFHILLHHVAGQQKIANIFKLCDPIDPGYTKKVDIANLYETLASNFANIVQYNKDNRRSSRTANITIETVCDVMTDEKIGMPIDRLAHINNLLLTATEEKCLDYRYAKMIHELRNVTWASEQAEGGRQWMYQTCTEFGFFQTSTARPKLFSNTFPVDFFAQQCVDVFGPKFNMHTLEIAVPRRNILYGGLDLEVTNVVFVHGSVDPWHVLGLTHSSNPQAPAIFINGTAHCANMYPPSDRDMPQLKQARVQIKGLIEQWLNN